MQTESQCQRILNRELEDRKSRNPSYSLRAFARDLGIGSTSLSDVLAYKRKLSKKNIEKVSAKLSLSPIEMDLLFQENQGPYRKTKNEIKRLEIEEDSFRLMADWYYLGILNFAKLTDNKACPIYIAERFAISVEQAQTALNRLLRMNLIEVKEDKLIRTSNPISTTYDIPSRAIKKHHRDNLRIAELSLENDQIFTRNFNSVTMAIDPSKIPEAKVILQKTVEKIEKVLEVDDPTEVYTLSFQLFPITSRGTNES